jgi:Set1/Ash2 histone methyltransferase complex subunit ASH2
MVHLNPHTHIRVSSDQLTAHPNNPTGGYKSILANAAAQQGNWFFEANINLGIGHTRIGFTTSDINLNTPAGYDKNGYSMRSTNGDVFHQAAGKPYGEEFGPGDIIGCLIVLPELDPVVKSQRIAQTYGRSADKKLLLPKSRIKFYKNGVDLGVAFSPIYEGAYFPVISLYNNASVTFNPGPKFAFPRKEEMYAPFSDARITN